MSDTPKPKNDDSLTLLKQIGSRFSERSNDTSTLDDVRLSLVEDEDVAFSAYCADPDDGIAIEAMMSASSNEESVVALVREYRRLQEQVGALQRITSQQIAMLLEIMQDAEGIASLYVNDRNQCSAEAVALGRRIHKRVQSLFEDNPNTSHEPPPVHLRLH